MKTDVSALFKVAEVELIYRNEVSPEDRLEADSPNRCYHILSAAWDRNKIELVEQCKVLLLDESLYCLGIADISTGGVNGCIVDPKLLFAIALKARSSRIVIAHNHPSGGLKPSKHDIEVTNMLVAGGNLLNIDVMDHLILTAHGYYSTSSNGHFPSPKM